LLELLLEQIGANALEARKSRTCPIQWAYRISTRSPALSDYHCTSIAAKGGGRLSAAVPLNLPENDVASIQMNQPPANDAPYFLRRLADQVPSMLAYWDKDLLCRFANRAYERWFGVDADALIGKSIRVLLGPELFALNESHIKAALAGQPQTFERLVPGADGVGRHSLAHYLPDIVDGVVRGFAVQVTDVSALKTAEAALKESELKFRTLAESSPSGVYYADMHNWRTYTNARWQEIFGLYKDKSLGDGWMLALHPADRERVLAEWKEAAAHARDLSTEFRICRADQVRLVRTDAKVVRDEDGRMTGFVGSLDDITKEREVQERLRASEHFLDRTGQIAGVGGWAADLRTEKVTWSSQTRRIHEVDAEYVPAFPGAREFYTPDAWAQLDAAVQIALREGTSWDIELPFITARKRALWVRVFGEAEYEDGVPVRLVGAFQDITEHKRHKAELQREQELRLESERHAFALSQLLKERGEMLDVLAHEVRQPLNNASAALQAAATTMSGVRNEVATGRLARAQAVIGQVQASIDNTLAVASLLARPEPIRPSDADIDTLLAVAIADMPVVERRRVVIDRVTGTRTASMDMSLMRLALRNLLSNALRYSPSDKPVVVRVTDLDEPLALAIDVEDAGPGVPASSIPHLFERGIHERANVTPPHGLGLGLYIVRRVMELHGGRVELVHNDPAGATFRVLVIQHSDA
jgi:PAS domain S-box-containing protein